MLDSDSTVICDRGPDGNGLTGHIATPVQPHPACHGAICHAGQPNFVLDLTMERLLEFEEKTGYF